MNKMETKRHSREILNPIARALARLERRTDLVDEEANDGRKRGRVVKNNAVN